jgi:ABC-type Fe3+-hydroxamate transport system substrate-binding protein
MPEYFDQLNNSILLDKVPKRIVCLVPSITELLVDLGLENDIVGITKFCIEPAYLKKQTILIGGTKNINIDKIVFLKPDLIIANKEENIEQDVNILKAQIPVYISDVKNLQDNLNLIKDLGAIFEKELVAQEIINKTIKIFEMIKSSITTPVKVLYLIWKNPYMTIGTDTYIYSILSTLGMINCVNDIRYPEVNLIDLEGYEVILLSSEPYPFNNSDKKEIATLKNNKRIFLVDGTYFSWYGSRLSKSKDYFKKLITNFNETT